MSLELQEKIVTELVSSINSKWDRVTADIEIDEVSGELVMSPDCRYHLDNKYTQFSTDIELDELFEELRDTMREHDQNNKAWTVTYLDVSPSGKYSFKFSYDEPPRLTKLKNS